MTELVGIPVSVLAPSALCGLFVLLVFTGQLIPKRTHDEVVHDRNEWRAESRVKDQQVVELQEQNAKMLNAFGPTLTDFLRSLRRAGVEARDEEHGT